MADPHLIGPIARSTPAATSWPHTQRPIPDDLLRDASRRLGIMSLVAAGLWTLGTALWHLAVGSTSQRNLWLRLGVPDAIAAVSVAASLLLFWYTRKGDRDPKGILDLGLAYMVFTAFAMGLIVHWQPLPVNRSILPEISWNGAVVLMFAAIVPSTPTKTLVAGLIAVSMNPVAMLIARARGTWNFDSTTDAMLMHYQDYLLLGVAVVISHVVTTLGRQVAKAREMGSYHLGSCSVVAGWGKCTGRHTGCSHGRLRSNWFAPG